MRGRLTQAIALLATPSLLVAQGHGPIFGLSTPTLGKGAWSLDATAMGRALEDQQTAMIRMLLSYGVNEDLQISASLPMAIYATQGAVPTRVSARMPASSDIEFTLGWRFQRRELGIAKRLNPRRTSRLITRLIPSARASGHHQDSQQRSRLAMRRA